jgi:hypothetical protein
MCGTASATKTITVNPIVSASVSMAASPGSSLCDVTSPVTFTPTAVNGGSAPAFLWYVNGAPVVTGPSYTYSPANGDVVKVRLTSNALCAIPDTASANMTMTITAPRVPSVIISVSPNDTVCTPSVVAYSVTPVNGGTTPIYEWNKNGVVVGTGPVLGSMPVTGDIVYCTMTSNLWCISAATALSNIIIMRVEAPAVNTITISVSKSAIFLGTVDTFLVVAPHAGPAALYQWYIDGVAVPGAISTTYITDTLKPGQTVNCSVISDNVCVTPHTVISKGIKVLVATGINDLQNASDLQIVPNPNTGVFTVKGSIRSANENEVSLEITNMTGQIVYKEIVPVQNGMLNKQIAPGSNLPNGVYLLHVNTGGTPGIIRFTISR